MHAGAMGGHLGTEKTLAKVKERKERFYRDTVSCLHVVPQVLNLCNMQNSSSKELCTSSDNQGWLPHANSGSRYHGPFTKKSF